METLQESKFQKYMKQIDNYDKLENRISKQQLEQVTIEIITEYKK